MKLLCSGQLFRVLCWCQGSHGRLSDLPEPRDVRRTQRILPPPSLLALLYPLCWDICLFSRLIVLSDLMLDRNPSQMVQAIMVAAVCEFLGASLLGAGVTGG